jgi:hypothetical protein
MEDDFDYMIAKMKAIKISDLDDLQIHLLLRILNEKLDEIKKVFTER